MLPFLFAALGASALLSDHRRSDRFAALRARLGATALTGDGNTGAPVIDLGRLVEHEHRPEPPKMYRVVLHNDPRMSGEVAFATLQRHFRKSGDEAMRIMLAAHRAGQASVGIYTREVAETRVEQAKGFSRDEMTRLFGLRNEIRLEAVPEERPEDAP